jgi:hypothetical protein
MPVAPLQAKVVPVADTNWLPPLGQWASPTASDVPTTGAPGSPLGPCGPGAPPGVPLQAYVTSEPEAKRLPP